MNNNRGLPQTKMEALDWAEKAWASPLMQLWGLLGFQGVCCGTSLLASRHTEPICNKHREIFAKLLHRADLFLKNTTVLWIQMLHSELYAPQKLKPHDTPADWFRLLQANACNGSQWWADNWVLDLGCSKEVHVIRLQKIRNPQILKPSRMHFLYCLSFMLGNIWKREDLQICTWTVAWRRGMKRPLRRATVIWMPWSWHVLVV